MTFTSITFTFVIIVLTSTTNFSLVFDVFFALEQLLHLYKFWTIYHMLSIDQTTNMQAYDLIFWIF
jgi:hypothetical protein